MTRKSPLSTTETPNTWEHITTYNNFYEFEPGAGDGPSKLAKVFKPADPWTVTVEGECAKPGKMNLEDILKGETLEDRIYRLRCVEAWSMVIPWVGFPLANLIKRVEPTVESEIRRIHHACTTRGRFPGQQLPVLDWPYVEGLRMDEAMHPLTILSRRSVRRGPAEPERRADSPGRPLEIRVQERQVDREDPVRGEAAAEYVAEDRAAGIRLLLQRQPGGVASALEPGHRAAAARASSRTTRPRCSTATATRSPACTPGWI